MVIINMEKKMTIKQLISLLITKKQTRYAWHRSYLINDFLKK